MHARRPTCSRSWTRQRRHLPASARQMPIFCAATRPRAASWSCRRPCTPGRRSAAVVHCPWQRASAGRFASAWMPPEVCKHRVPSLVWQSVTCPAKIARTDQGSTRVVRPVPKLCCCAHRCCRLKTAAPLAACQCALCARGCTWRTVARASLQASARASCRCLACFCSPSAEAPDSQEIQTPHSKTSCGYSVVYRSSLCCSIAEGPLDD